MKKLPAYRGALHIGTLAGHHYIEHHTALGQAMAQGTATREEYGGWLWMKAAFFAAVGGRLLPAAQRAEAYIRDAEALGVPRPDMPSADRHAAWLHDPHAEDWERERRQSGTIYVCAGSVFGAEVIRRAILARHPEWPVDALAFVDRRSEIAYLEQLRNRCDCIPEAYTCFEAMVGACDEITNTPRA